MEEDYEKEITYYFPVWSYGTRSDWLRKTKK